MKIIMLSFLVLFFSSCVIRDALNDWYGAEKNDDSATVEVVPHWPWDED